MTRAQKQRSDKQNRRKEESTSQPTQKPPLQPLGVVFALAANMLVVTAAHILVVNSGLPPEAEVLATFVGPVVVGIATAFYVRERGGIHAFLGGMVSVPLLAYIVFSGYWQPALFAGAFCGLSGSVAEVLLRRGR
jgi:hypothetical protein